MNKLIPALLIPGLLFFFGCSGSNDTTSFEGTVAGGENTTDCSNGTIYGALEVYKTLLVTDSENPKTYVFLGYDESQDHNWDIRPAIRTACDEAIKVSTEGNLRYFYILNSSEVILGNFNCENNTYLSAESGKISLEDICHEN